MTREDLPAVAELEKICFSEPWSLAQLSDSLHRQEYTFLVATEEADPSRVAGYLGARIVLDEMDIANVAVFPEYRKQGLAQELLYYYCRREQARKRNRLVLTCLASKVKMYTKLGFRTIGENDEEYIMVYEF